MLDPLGDAFVAVFGEVETLFGAIGELPTDKVQLLLLLDLG